MKKCVLINCFAGSNEMRVEPVREILEERGYQTLYVSSDYHHALKKYVELDKSVIPVHVRSYKKNLSIDRLLSHKEFSREVYKLLCKEEPDLVYVKFPPNTLVKEAYRYKKTHNCKVIMDLFDLWPESLPVSEKMKKAASPLLKVWSNYRDRYISCADLMLTECDMYREELKGILPENTHTLYLTKNDIAYEFHPCKPGQIRLCYLGGINNLIDLALLEKCFSRLSKRGKVSLDIIGDGIQKDELIKIARAHGCETAFHGVVYDENEKYKIMSQCDFGINVVKDTVKIALSIKSIEYFRAGLAVLNTVKFDTAKIIEKSGAGINLDSVEKLGQLGEEAVNAMKQRSRGIFEEYFCREVFYSRLNEFLDI